MKKTSVILKFPKQFAVYVNNITAIDFNGEKMSDFIEYLDSSYGNVRERLLEPDGRVRPYINIYVGKKNISSLQGLETVVPQGERISILISRAGG